MKEFPESQKHQKFNEFEKEFSSDQEMLLLSKSVWLTSRANEKGKLGLIHEAIKDYNEAIEINPDHLPAYFGKATAFKILGQDEEVKKIEKIAPEYTFDENGEKITREDLFKLLTIS